MLTDSQILDLTDLSSDHQVIEHLESCAVLNTADYTSEENSKILPPLFRLMHGFCDVLAFDLHKSELRR